MEEKLTDKAIEMTEKKDAIIEMDSETDAGSSKNLYKEVKETIADNDGENRHIKEEDKIGYMGAAATIVKAIIGTGITNMPMLFKVLGIIPATALMIINLFLHINTVRFLMVAKRITQRYSYSFYSKAAMGSFGTVMMKLSITILSFFTCCVYLKFFGKIVYMLVTVFLGKGEGFFYTEPFYIIIVFFVIMPLMFKKDLSSLKKWSFLGVYCIFIALGCILIIFTYRWFNGLIKPFDKKLLFPSGKLLDICNIVPASLDAYIFQQNTFPIYTQLKPRSTNTMMKATILGVLFSFIAYQITGTLGLILYGTDINDIILVYFRRDIEDYREHTFLVITCFVCIVCFFISALLGFPFNFLNARNNASSLIQFIKLKLSGKEEEEPKKEEENKGDKIETGLRLDSGLGFLIITLTIYVLILGLAIAAKKIIIISNYSGVSCNNYITVMSPALFMVFLLKKWDINRCLGVLIFLFGVSMMILFVASEILKA
ncbi:MAG: amino acid transporter [archaeon]|nr:amino acid transporter [archaeon]